MLRGKTPALLAAALVLGLVGWSCTSDEGVAPPKPDQPKAGAAEKPAPKVEAAPTATEKAETLVPLNLNPHPPRDVGTPLAAPRNPKIEPLETKRPPVMVAEGCTNLALKRPVTSSTKYFITGDLSLITNGDTDGSEGGYVELDPGKQWVQIDLGAPSRIFAIAVYHYSRQQRVYHDVVIQVSDDPDFIKDVRTVFNNDYDNSSGLGVGKDLEYVEDFKGRVIQVPGVLGRYVRLWSNGNSDTDTNHYIEVEVYGKPAK